MRPPRSFAVAVAVAACVTAGCGSSSKATTSTTPASSPTTSAATTVVLKNIAFNPDTVSIKAGDTVTWEWKDNGIPHNVDGKSSLSDLYSGSPQTSGTYQYTFAKPGTYHVTCDVHTTMKLTVTVS